VIEQVLMSQAHDEAFFWASHQGAEIDLILRNNGRMFGLECKRTDTPRLTPSIRIALDDLGLERVVVIYTGTKRFPLSEQVDAIPFRLIAEGTPLFN